jgi:serine/threonine-protein kinase
MEFVDGPTLDQVLSGTDPLPAEQIFSILGQTSNALDYAHGKSIVHRDIKPANIMIAGDGTTKITDFGIAKITTAEQMTMTGSIVGTPHYMSPEQVQGQPVDGRSDQFSLAVIAYELLTGEKPYTGQHLTTVVYKIVAEEPVLPHRLNPSLAGAIESVIRKGLSKRADSRYRNCQEFTDALEKACAATKDWRLMPRGGVLNEPTMADMASPGAAPKLPPPRRPRRNETTATVTAKKKSGFFPFLLAVLFVAAMLAGIGWQAAPWLAPGAKHNQQAAVEHPSETLPAPKTNPPPPGEAKPSPMGPAATPPATVETPAVAPPLETKPATGETPKKATEEPAQTEPKPEPKAPVTPPTIRRSVAAQDVMVVSSPGGATATLDGNPALACKTPCTLQASPGRHTVAVVLPGYQIERHEITVGSGPTEMPPVLLHPVGGTLMLSSEPRGATVTVDGKKIDKVTPAQIPLALGTYSITVEKDGQSATQRVEITNGLNYCKIMLGQ